MEGPLICDRYRPLAELGAGGAGSVLLAFDTKLARRVAIKRLPLSRHTAGLAEARTAAMLAHPNIVTVYEWQTDEGAAYVVMEHVEGLSLADVLDGIDTPLDDDEAAAIVRAVGAALSFAHANGVLHLDVKPENVLIARDGRIQLADFGIAALTDRRSGAPGGAGTVGYMPPEQLRGQPVDETADEWAFAALVYEALTLANPFVASTREGSLFKTEVAPVPAPSEFAPGLAPGIDEVLLTALSPEPAARYPSVGDLTAILLDLLGDPAAGEESLADVVSSLLEDEEAFTPQPVVGLWDRLAPYASWFRRAGAAVAGAWLAWAGLAPLVSGSLALAGSAALVAAAGVLAPGLGIGLGLVSFAVGIVASAGPAWGAAFALAAGAWWVLRGRAGAGDAQLPLFAPLLGVARVPLLAPLVAGFAFEPLPAAAASGVAALVTMAVSAATGGAPPYLSVDPRFFAAPWTTVVPLAARDAATLLGPLAAVAGWATSAAVMSLACRGGRRGSAALGTVLAALPLAGGYAVWGMLGQAPPLPALMENAAGAAMAMVVVVALGPPVRGRASSRTDAD